MIGYLYLGGTKVAVGELPVPSTAQSRKVEDREAVFVPLPALRAGNFPEHLQ